jgi:hypothetical protein
MAAKRIVTLPTHLASFKPLFLLLLTNSYPLVSAFWQFCSGRLAIMVLCVAIIANQYYP